MLGNREGQIFRLGSSQQIRQLLPYLLPLSKKAVNQCLP